MHKRAHGNYDSSLGIRELRVRDLTQSLCACSKKKTTRKASFYFFFSPKKLVRLFILKGVKPSSDGTMMKLVIFDNLLPPLRHFR